jgi:hypothetical protein
VSAQEEATRNQESTAPSRASPELAMAEIEGQVYDPTSGLTFLHRAWRRLSTRNTNAGAEEASKLACNQPLFTAGDKPLPGVESRGTPGLQFPDPVEARHLLTLYFDVCIATYRFLYRSLVEDWLVEVECNIHQGRPLGQGIGHAKAAIVLVALAIAVAHREKSKGETGALWLSDYLFGQAVELTDAETGYPQLESAQARLIQVLYLLTTSRFNRAWFLFGTTLQIVVALGLHRRVNHKRHRATVYSADSVQKQCGLRTFWTVYILDNYLGLVFGRPRHLHDDDINQDLPDRVGDEDMALEGDEPESCHVDALIHHAKIARIIGSITHDVYSVRDVSEEQRRAAVHLLIERVNEWNVHLPLHLGSIPPSMLIPSYRRQATVLRLAYSHAMMHATRLFLSGSSAAMDNHNAIACIDAAKAVLDTVDKLAKEGPIFHAFWWTHYVTFCALVIVYVWEIQIRRTDRPDSEARLALREKAAACHLHLAQATATNSPSRRYALILDEFRQAASNPPPRPELQQDPSETATDDAQLQNLLSQDMPLMHVPNLLDEWQTSDWVDLDSSAFWPETNFDESMAWFGIV